MGACKRELNCVEKNLKISKKTSPDRIFDEKKAFLNLLIDIKF